MNDTMDTEFITSAEADFPALAQLCGGYYHQDWREDNASPDEALQAFIRDTSPETVTAAASDIDRLLGAGLDDAALARLLADGLDCNYVAEADGINAPAWLANVRDSLRAAA
jgi:CdiI immunity protein